MLLKGIVECLIHFCLTDVLSFKPNPQP